MSALRLYTAGDLGRDGYPVAWYHGTPAIKDLAGWYAHAYLDQDITRVEAEARLGELLELEAA